MSRQSDNIIRQIEQITENLRKVRMKIALLGDMETLTAGQKQTIESLGRGLDGVRGGELGTARQSLGLDEDLKRAGARGGLASRRNSKG